jgi:hypothetical protein
LRSWFAADTRLKMSRGVAIALALAIALVVTGSVVRDNGDRADADIIITLGLSVAIVAVLVDWARSR